MDCRIPGEDALEARGWQRRLMASEPRLSEMAEEYRQLGFEVRLEPVDPAACRAKGQCTTCFADPEAAASLGVLYTRRQ